MDDDCCEVEEHTTDTIGMGLVCLASHQCYKLTRVSRVNVDHQREDQGLVLRRIGLEWA